MMDSMIIDADQSLQFRAAFDEVKAELTAGATASQRALSRRPSTAPEDRDRGHLPSVSSSRAEHVSAKIRELESRISAAAPALEDELRFARNVAVLTPFRQTTRDRLVAVLAQLARRIAILRMDLAKMRSHRDTLVQDLSEERRQWMRTKTQALQIANAALQQNSRMSVLPRVTVADGSTASQSPPISPRSPRTPSLRLRTSTDVPDARRLAPSTPKPLFLSPVTPAESFDSNRSSTAPSDSELDADRDNEADDSLGPLVPPSASASTSTFHTGESSVASTSSTRDRSSSSLVRAGSGHEKFFTATESPEEAEEWDRTRAAKRVSLVRLPADTLAVIFSHHTRHISDGTPGQGEQTRDEKRHSSS